MKAYIRVDEQQKRKNRTKVKVRAKVEWPFRILKRVFGFIKVRYRGLKKNHEWLCAAFASINIYPHRRRLGQPPADKMSRETPIIRRFVTDADKCRPRHCITQRFSEIL
jgi:hypothetical protein